MIRHISSRFSHYPTAFANWGNLILMQTEPFFEVAVLGTNAELICNKLNKNFRPNVIWAFSKTESNVPVLKERFVQGKTLIYVCKEGVCKLPVENEIQALELLN